MHKVEFTLHPNIFHALFPKFVWNMCIFALAALPVYVLVRVVEANSSLVFIEWRVIFALVVIVVAGAFLHVKFDLVRLHRTKYVFYEDHMALVRKIVRVQRHSLPYGQIMKITNDHKVWDRLTNTANLVLHTQQEEKDFVLRSIKNPEDVEARIYKLIHRKNQSE